jgi:predicted nucleic acid-binding protein
MIRVVDASAIAALIFGEPDKPWVESEVGSAELIAPLLLSFELGNICWKKLRRFPTEADTLLAAWDAWCVSDLVATELCDPVQTIRLARIHALTFYDASYLWLAEHRNVGLISLDARLVRTARSLGLHAPTPHTTPRTRN